MSDSPYPGVYVDEADANPRAIQGVDASTAGFAGVARSGPAGVASAALTSFGEFARSYGDSDDLVLDRRPTLNHLAHAVRAFFANGGRRLHVARVPTDPAPGSDGAIPTTAAYAAALAALSAVGDIAMLAVPGYSAAPDAVGIQTALLAAVDDPGPTRGRIAMLEAPEASTVESVQDWRRGIPSGRGALYFPWVVTTHPRGTGELVLPPTGFVCGLYARNDAERSVARAPANIAVHGALRFSLILSDQQQSELNPLGINCLRHFPGRGNLVWGARTTSPDPEWKYISVRRYLDYLKASVDRGTQWVLFEPNAGPLWERVTRSINAFLHQEWRQGSFPGRRPADAYFVRCDRSTMTRADIDAGRLVCEIGVAPLRPAEFIVFRISQSTARPA